MAGYRTDPGDRSVTELESEVNQERARLSDTIDALKEKASVGNILDQVVQAVGENGGEVSRNLGRTLRDHPLPALLTGVGLVWLMASSGQPPYRSDRYGDEDEDYFRRYGAMPPKPEPVGSADRSYAESSYSEPDYEARDDYADEALEAWSGDREARDDDGGPSVGDRAHEATSQLRERASELAAGAQERMSAAADRVRRTGYSVRRRATETGRGALHAGHDAGESVDRLMHEQPFVLGAIALALGAAVGGALPRSQTEDRLFGARASRARQSLRSMAEEQGRKVKATAGVVAQEAQAIAGEAAQELGQSMPSGQELVEKAEGRLSDAASRLREAGATEAERQDLGRISTGE
jgi:hypothetical protein